MESNIVMISIDKLIDYSDHPYKVLDDEAMDELCESVRTVGVLVPIIVRTVEDGRYEIISGHRRKRACEREGIGTIPAVITKLSDDEAAILLVDSNLHRENILPSEKAYAYKLKLDAMKHQGKKKSGSFGQNVRKSESTDEIGLDSSKSGINNTLTPVQKRRIIWSFVISDSFNNEKTNEFNLFGEVDYLLDETLKNISFQHIRENFNWEYFTDLVARSVFCLAPNNSNFNSSADLQALLRFSENIANIVKFKETYNNEHMDDTIAYWGRDMCGLYLDAAFNIPENRKKEYLYFKCNYYFHYCKGFIDNGYMDLIKENIFFRSISNLYYNIDNSKILYYLSIDCYLYYLSEKESQACVDSDLQSAAKKLLEDKQIVNLNDYFFSRIHCLISGFESLENDLLKVLKKCEWFPKYGNSKTLIMEDVVREFYIFMQTIMNHSYSYISEGSYKIIAQPFVYVNQFLEGNEERTKESLKRFYSLFKSTSNDLDIEVKAMYLMFGICT